MQDLSNALQEKILNQRKADKLSMLMKNLVRVWQNKLWKMFSIRIVGVIVQVGHQNIGPLAES